MCRLTLQEQLYISVSGVGWGLDYMRLETRTSYNIIAHAIEVLAGSAHMKANISGSCEDLQVSVSIAFCTISQR